MARFSLSTLQGPWGDIIRALYNRTHVTGAMLADALAHSSMPDDPRLRALVIDALRHPNRRPPHRPRLTVPQRLERQARTITLHNMVSQREAKHRVAGHPRPRTQALRDVAAQNPYGIMDVESLRTDLRAGRLKKVLGPMARGFLFTADDYLHQALTGSTDNPGSTDVTGGADDA